MSGVDERVERVRAALMDHQPPHHDPPCEHGCCAPHFALDSLAALVASLEQRAAEAEKALRLVEKNCPCGARPESLHTHPHVTGCPVGEVLGGTISENYARAVGAET